MPTTCREVVVILDMGQLVTAGKQHRPIFRAKYEIHEKRLVDARLSVDVPAFTGLEDTTHTTRTISAVSSDHKVRP